MKDFTAEHTENTEFKKVFTAEFAESAEILCIYIRTPHLKIKLRASWSLGVFVVNYFALSELFYKSLYALREAFFLRVLCVVSFLSVDSVISVVGKRL